MNPGLFIRLFFYGILTWVIPFIVSFLFYNREGELAVPYELFKSVMIVIGAITGSVFLYLSLIRIEKRLILNAVLIGTGWYMINILLDVVVLIPMMKISFSDYFMSIGIRYLLIPVMSITIAGVSEKKPAS